MKKLISMLVALAMLTTMMVSGAVVASAATTPVAGGTYGAHVWDDELELTADNTTVDNDAKTVTFNIVDADDKWTTNFAGTISNLSTVQWANTGVIEINYDVTLNSVTEETKANTYVGLIGVVSHSGGNNKWPTNGTMDGLMHQISFPTGTANGTTKNAKSVYRFTEDKLYITLYTKNAGETEWVASENEYVYDLSAFATPATFSRENYKFFRLGYYGCVTASQNKEEYPSATVNFTVSNISIKESYTGLLLEDDVAQYTLDDDAEINFCLPDDYASAKLTVGGIECVSMNSSAYAAGAYKATFDLAQLTYTGNIPVELSVKKTDGTTVKETSALDVFTTATSESLGLDTFSGTVGEEYDPVYTMFNYNWNTFPYEIANSSTVGGTTGTALHLDYDAYDTTAPGYEAVASNKNYKSGNTTMNHTFSPALTDEYCVDLDADIYIENKATRFGIYLRDNTSGTVVGGGDVHNWNYIINRYISTNDSTARGYFGRWIHVKFTVNLINNMIYMYIDGELATSFYAGEKTSEVVLNGLKHVGLCYEVQAITGLESRDFWLDNYEMTIYKPAVGVESFATTADAIRVTFDAPITYTEGGITLGGVDSTVAYDADTKTAVITPVGAVNSLNGTVEVAASVAGKAMSIPVKMPVATPFYYDASLTSNSGVYTGKLSVYNNTAAKLGKLYVAIYNGAQLAQVSSVDIDSVAGVAEIECPLTPAASGTYTAKMFVWDEDFAPILPVVTP